MFFSFFQSIGKSNVFRIREFPKSSQNKPPKGTWYFVVIFRYFFVFWANFQMSQDSEWFPECLSGRNVHFWGLKSSSDIYIYLPFFGGQLKWVLWKKRDFFWKKSPYEVNSRRHKRNFKILLLTGRLKNTKQSIKQQIISKPAWILGNWMIPINY